MKHKHAAFSYKLLMGVAAILSSVSVFGAEQEPQSYALLIQQSPADGGMVTPGAGVHKFDVGQSVPLSAMPRPGYRFLYWLGDVSKTSSSNTSVSLDSPKMVIAVFERESFEEDLFEAGPSKSVAGGSSGLRASPYPMTSPGSVSIGSYAGDVTIIYPSVEDGEQIPEPATLLLLGLGAAAIVRKRYHRLSARP